MNSGVRAFLASAGLGALEAWVAQHLAPGARVGFVDIAARPLPDQDFVTSSREELRRLGLVIVELDLGVGGATRVEPVLQEVDCVFVTGGYPLLLLERAQATGFLDAARPLLRAGTIAYVGVSAGAALAGPDMEPLAAADDPGRPNGTTCLGLIPFVVVPHANRRPLGAFASSSPCSSVVTASSHSVMTRP